MLQMSIMPFVVSFIVNKHTNEIQSIDVLYAVNAKKEPAGSLSPEVSTPPTGSTISISNLIDYVNYYFPDILPESVLKHYGYSSRPEENVGKSALFSRDVNIDSRHNFSNALSKAEFRQFYSILDNKKWKNN